MRRTWTSTSGRSVSGSAISTTTAWRTSPRRTFFTDRLAILRGDGVGGFAPQSATNTYATEFSPERVHGARLRPGGPVDLVIAHSTWDGFLSCARNRGDGTFTFAPEDRIYTGGRPSAFILGDVDGDDAPDAVVGNSGTSTVAILLDSLGWFGRGTTLPIGGGRPVALALGDLDGDGRADLVVGIEHAHSIRVFRGAGDGDFTPGQEIRPGLRPLSIALADLDADGNLDLVTGQGADFPTSGLVVVYRGDGHGRSVPTIRRGRRASAGSPTRLLVLDLDGDGVLEIVTANRGSSTVTLVPGPGARGFALGTSLHLGTEAEAEALVAGDVDRDGRPDLLSAGRAAHGSACCATVPGIPIPSAWRDARHRARRCPNPFAATGDAVRVALISGGAIDFADILRTRSASRESPRSRPTPNARRERGGRRLHDRLRLRGARPGRRARRGLHLRRGGPCRGAGDDARR